ncbi:MAG: enoyl-CoA hydratase [Gammaproteobacteria bacterium]|nr:enoyl-CoA hydratase [Gammaproteobacteria bacterium]
MANFIVITRAGPVLHLTINRPDKKNALTQAMYAELADQLDSSDRDPTIRIVTLTGAGDYFSSGNDVHDFDAFIGFDDTTPVVRFIKAIANCRKPIVAIVNGPAIGIGFTLLLHCDLVYAADTVFFNAPFTTLGLCPEAGSSYWLPLLAGYQRAAEILLLAERFDAQMAVELGLVNKVCKATELQSTVDAVLTRLRELPIDGLLTVKRLMKQAHRKSVEQTIQAELQEFAWLLQGEAFAEAFAAFNEKRKPIFHTD